MGHTQRKAWRCKLNCDVVLVHEHGLVKMAAHPSQRETGRNISVTPRTRNSSSCSAARNSQTPHWMTFSLLQLSLKLFCATIHQPRYLICNPAITHKQTHASFWMVILHHAHASSQGHERAYVRTVDIDVVVLVIAFLDQLHLSKLWIGFGTGKNYRDIPVHDIHSRLGPTWSRALPLCHALSGCDTTSQLLGCGKRQPSLHGRACLRWQIRFWNYLTILTHSQ